jgi:RNA polymerase sigma factor (sigma-70 family)
MATRTDGDLIRTYAESWDEPFDRAQGEAAFSELVSRHQQAVYRACLRMLGDSHEAQDATQATFIVLLRKASELRKEGSLSGWLHNVARKVALEAIRRRTVRARREDEFAAYNGADSAGTEAEVDTEAVLKVVDEALGELSPRLSEAVILRYVQGYSQKDAADMAKCPQGTFGRRAHDGLAKLRERLAKRGIAVGATVLAAVFEAEAQASVPETLLSSIMSASKTVAAGAAVGAGEIQATILAEGAMKEMMTMKIKLAVMAAMGVAVVGGVAMIAAQAAGKTSERMSMPVAKVEKMAPASGEAVSTNSPFWQFGSSLGQLAVLNTRKDHDKTAASSQAAFMGELIRQSKAIDDAHPASTWSATDIRSAAEGVMNGIGVRLKSDAGPALDKLCGDFVRENKGTAFQYDERTFQVRCSSNLVAFGTHLLTLVREEDQEKAKATFEVMLSSEGMALTDAQDGGAAGK